METKMDKGHENLVNDLKLLTGLAERYEFHDFKNIHFVTPKIELYKKLIDLANNVKDGRYDNE